MTEKDLALAVTTDFDDALALTLGVAPEVIAEVRATIGNNASANTRKTYDHAMSAFAAWCQQRGVAPLPTQPTVMLAYLQERVMHGCSVGTIDVCAKGIAYENRRWGHPDPKSSQTVAEWLRGMRREKKKAGAVPLKARALPFEDLLRMADSFDRNRIIGKRNRALLLYGFMSAMRRSELVAMRMENMSWTSSGLLYVFRQGSKTNQEAKHETVAVPFGETEHCPLAALREYLEAASVAEGCVFRSVNKADRVSDRALPVVLVNHILKQAAVNIGMTDTTAISGHSLRAGWITHAFRRQIPMKDIMDHARHIREATTYGYIRDDAKMNLSLSSRLGF